MKAPWNPPPHEWRGVLFHLKKRARWAQQNRVMPWEMSALMGAMTARKDMPVRPDDDLRPERHAHGACVWLTSLGSAANGLSQSVWCSQVGM